MCLGKAGEGYLEREELGQIKMSTFICLTNLHTVFHSGCVTVYGPTNNGEEFLFPHSFMMFVINWFLYDTILSGVR